MVDQEPDKLQVTLRRNSMNYSALLVWLVYIDSVINQEMNRLHVALKSKQKNVDHVFPCLSLIGYFIWQANDI